MELIMKLITRLVEALEKSAANSYKIVALAEQNLCVGRELLQLHKHQAPEAGGERIVGTHELTVELGDGKTPAGQAAAKEHDERIQREHDIARQVENKIAGEAVLAAAERAQLAERVAKQAEKTRAEQSREEMADTMKVVEERRYLSDEEKAKAQPAETKAKKTTVDDVRAALRKYAAVNGNEAAMGMLQKHDAVSVSAMDPSKYDAFLKDVA